MARARATQIYDKETLEKGYITKTLTNQINTLKNPCNFHRANSTQIQEQPLQDVLNIYVLFMGHVECLCLLAACLL